MASAGDSSTDRASCTAEQCGNRKRHPLYEITKCRVLINLNHECQDYYYIPWMASPVLLRLLAQMEWPDINRRWTVKTKDQIVNEFAIYRIKQKWVNFTHNKISFRILTLWMTPRWNQTVRLNRCLCWTSLKVRSSYIQSLDGAVTDVTIN